MANSQDRAEVENDPSVLCINFNIFGNILKCAIAAPMVPLRPALPWQFYVSSKLKPQLSDPAIKGFLSTLPKPLNWRFETEEERKDLVDNLENKNIEEIKRALAIASGKESRSQYRIHKARRIHCYQSIRRSI